MLKLFKKGAEKPLIVSNIAQWVTNGAEYFSQDLILLNEALKGSLYCAEQVLVEVDGSLTGNITGKICIISGTVNGNIVATEQLLIRDTAKINGNVSSPVLDIEPGAVLNGKIRIATDIYAIVELTEKLKNNMPSEEIPQKLRIVPEAVAVNGRTDEFAKNSTQKPNSNKPTAPRPAQLEPAQIVTPIKRQAVAAAAVSSWSADAQPEFVRTEIKPATAAIVSKPVKIEAEVSVTQSKPATPIAAPVAAAPKLNTDENAAGKWW